MNPLQKVILFALSLDYQEINLTGTTEKNILPLRSKNEFLLHVSREFYSVKLICRNLYALFSHARKADTANQKGIQLFSHVKV